MQWEQTAVPMAHYMERLKKDELANIYQGKGTPKEKETIYDIFFKINASQSNTWDRIKE